MNLIFIENKKNNIELKTQVELSRHKALPGLRKRETKRIEQGSVSMKNTFLFQYFHSFFYWISDFNL